MKKLIYLLPLVALCMVCLWGCEDDDPVVERLFRPNFVSATASENTITYSWKQIGNAVAYTIEICRNADFEPEAEFSATVTGTNYTFTGLRYNTAYYARVRAVSDGTTGDSNWTIRDGETKTETRVVPQLLQAIDTDEIGETDVTIHWTIDEANPVDSISVVKTEGSEVVREIVLAPEEMIGEYHIEGLEKSCNYTITIANTQAPEDAKTYNTQSFKTAGPPAEATVIGVTDNFAKILEEDLANSLKTSLIYYLEGADYYMLKDNALDLDEDGTVLGVKGKDGIEYKLTKSIRIIGNTKTKSTLWIRSKWTLVNSLEFLEFENVNIKQYINSEVGATANGNFELMNNGADLTNNGRVEISSYSIKNGDLTGFTRGLFLCNQAYTEEAPLVIKKLVMDGCRYTPVDPEDKTTAIKHGGWGVFHIAKGYTDIWSEISITNSTFYNCEEAKGLFGTPVNTLWASPAAGKVKVSNCTFFDFSTKQTLINVGNLPAPGVDITIEKCLIATANLPGGAICPSPSAANNRLVSAADNYYVDVDGWILNNKDGDLNFVPVGLSNDELFESPSTGNFTIKAKDSDVYKKGIGDPRWIK